MKPCLRSRAPSASSTRVRAVMTANLGGNLEPERMLRSELQKAGFRFRKNVRPIPNIRCEADIVFTNKKVCVFVDGCFWHGCPKHFTCPKVNEAWWMEKIEANRARDKKRVRELKCHGWKPIRVWEHCVRKDLVETVRRIRLQLQR
jgi:DNA mismatch endonuclease (patch repair protein)